MRNLINLGKQKQVELKQQFPSIRKLFNISEQSDYSHLAISVFDHTLTPEEVKLEINDNGSSYNLKYDKKLYYFCVALSESTTVNPVKLIGRYKTKVLFRSFTASKNAKKYLEPKPYHHHDLKRFVLALPIYDSIYFEGCDYTHHLYYKSFEKLDPVLELVKLHGLHIQKSF